jgi:DNA helicase II / ATP-dependent DNA helicase PcrA
MFLNPPQQEAVAHVEGPLLVFAGAGSGKTRVITYRIANLLATHGVPPYRILAVTFTNKAAAEMKERLIRLGTEEIVRDLWVGTFHSICCRLLRRYHQEVGLERNFVIYDDSDQKALLTRIMRQSELDEHTHPPKAVLSWIHKHKQEDIRPDQIDVRGKETTWLELYAAYEKALLAVNAVDFDDLILHMMRIAESQTMAGRELRERFDYLLVDEFQDTNAIQYRLIRALAAKGNLCVVGDDDQSIYSWRGANVANIRGFHRDFPRSVIVKLEQNYRSSGNIVAAALGIIQASKGREPKALWTEAEAGEKINVRQLSDERAEAGAVVESIQRDITRGVSPEEIAVFYRVNAQSRVLEEAFRGANVPYQVIGGMRFFERAEIKDMMAYLRVIENPRSDADLLRIINVPARGIGTKTVERVLQLAQLGSMSAFQALEAAVADTTLGTGPRKKLAAFRSLLGQLRKTAETSTPEELARKIVDVTGYRAALKEADSAEADARLENLEEFFGSLAEFEQDAEAAGDDVTLAAYLERVALIADIDSKQDVRAVSMMTVHSSKGLEFENVYLTGLEEKIFPYRGVDGESPEELEEERRLAYVAVTRARKRLTITHTGMRTLFGSSNYMQPSRFLTNIPKEVSDVRGNARVPMPYMAPGSFGYGRFSPPQRVSNPGYRKPKAYDDFDQSPSHEPEPETGSSGARIDYDVFDDITPEVAAADAASWTKGTRVLHERFGRGTVLSVVPGETPKVLAVFAGWGEKKVLASALRKR